MDILYVLGSDSQWNDNEIRFSLRSLAKFGKNIGRVYIVGERPYFINPKTVTHIPGAHDIYPQAHKNILHKVLWAIKHSDISRHFLISSDDHFYIKPVDFARLPVYYREKDIPAVLDVKQTLSPYCRSLVETREMLVRHGLTTYQTNPHCNTHWDTDVYERNRKLFDEAMTLRHGGELNCIMGNLLIKDGRKPTLFHDSKLGHKVKNAAQFKVRVANANCVSGVPDIANTYLGQILPQLFPDKCIYEK